MFTVFRADLSQLKSVQVGSSRFEVGSSRSEPNRVVSVEPTPNRAQVAFLLSFPIPNCKGPIILL